MAGLPPFHGQAQALKRPGQYNSDYRFTQASFAQPEHVARITAITALGRTGTPEDIGGVVAFLCSAEARWITGQRLEVSGGMNL